MSSKLRLMNRREGESENQAKGESENAERKMRNAKQEKKW